MSIEGVSTEIWSYLEQGFIWTESNILLFAIVPFIV